MQNRSTLSEDAVPEDILTCSDPATLCHWLCRFSAETRPKAGGHYPPSTSYALIAGLQRYMKSIKPNAPTILDKKTLNLEVYTIALMFYSGECEKATREQLWYTTNPFRRMTVIYCSSVVPWRPAALSHSSMLFSSAMAFFFVCAVEKSTEN